MVDTKIVAMPILPRPAMPQLTISTLDVGAVVHIREPTTKTRIDCEKDCHDGVKG